MALQPEMQMEVFQDLDLFEDFWRESGGIPPPEADISVLESCLELKVLEEHMQKKHEGRPHPTDQDMETVLPTPAKPTEKRRTGKQVRTTKAVKCDLPKRKPLSCCDICGAILRGTASLRKHKRTHLPKEDQPYTCPECGHKCTQRQNLTRHIKTVHLGERITCDAEGCGRDFSRADKLRAHQETHPVEGRLYCPGKGPVVDQCRYLCYTAERLATHMRCRHPPIRNEE